MRCPSCSYENPSWPGWMRALGRWLAHWEGCDAVFQGAPAAAFPSMPDDVEGTPGPRLRVLPTPPGGSSPGVEDGKDAA